MISGRTTWETGKKIPDQNHNNVAAAVSIIKDEFVQGHTMNVDTYI